MRSSRHLLAQQHEKVYDDFTGAVIDARRWTIVESTGPDGRVHAYQDRNARVRTGDGLLEMAIIPFTRFHDSVPMLNNAKQMYRSTERVDVPQRAEVTFAVTMAVETYRQVPFDLRDAFAMVSLIDFATGTVLGFAATNDTIYAVVERLLMPGVAATQDQFIHRIVVDSGTGPGDRHRYSIAYRGESTQAIWYLDGQRAYWARTPVPVRGFHLGMGLFSARDLGRFGREEREHGQGARSSWGPWKITTKAPPHPWSRCS